MQQNNNIPIAISIVIAGALIAGGIFLSSMYGPNKGSSTVAGIQGGQPTAPVDPYAANTELAKNVLPVSEEDHIIGDRDAKVAIIEYSDLDCPFCQKIHSTLQQITKDYDKSEVVSAGTYIVRAVSGKQRFLSPGQVEVLTQLKARVFQEMNLKIAFTLKIFPE